MSFRNPSVRHPSVEKLEARQLLYAGNFVVSLATSSGTKLREYDQAGGLVGEVGVPLNGADGGARDVQVDENGDQQVFTGGFSPVLQRHVGPVNAANTTWVKESGPNSAPGWSQAGRTFHGGIATVSRYVFAPDEATANSGAAKGLIRFDAAGSYTASRFATDQEFSDVTIGMDGLLYALESGGSQSLIWVYNPSTLAFVRTVSGPGFDNTSVVADTQGNLFIASFSDDKIYKVSPTGTLLDSVDVRAYDMDISTDNQLLISDGSSVRLFDSDLNQLKSFPLTGVTGGTSYVAFAEYQEPLVTPGARVSGTVYNDYNANGTRDAGEPGLAGARVYHDNSNNGIYEAGERYAVSKADGTYALTGLTAGTVRLRIDAPKNFRITGIPSQNFSVASTSNVTGKNLFATTRARLIGTLFNDLNGNGIRNTGEGPLVGWRVFLDENGDGLYQKREFGTVTDDAGNYALAPAGGTYALRTGVAAGYRNTFPNAGLYNLSLKRGSTADDLDFYFTRKVLLSGVVFNDTNGDGIINRGEGGLAGRRVWIDADNDGVFDTTESSILTGADGGWRFTSRGSGTYVIRFAPAPGNPRTTPAGGAYTVTLGAGKRKIGLAFGEKVIV